MGPKGERGPPGSIVWNGVKVSLYFFFLVSETCQDHSYFI